MLYLRRIFKAIAFFLLLTAITYTGLWFYSSYKIKEAIAEYSTKTETPRKFSYEKLDISGFPFKLKLQFHNIRSQYNFDKKPLSIASSYDNLDIETNILFNDFKFYPSKKLLHDITYDGKTSKLEDTVKGDFYLELTEANSNNFFKIIKALYKNEIPQDLDLKSFCYKAEDIISIDRNTNKEVLHSSYDINFIFDKQSDLITDLTIKNNIKLEVIGDRALIPILDQLPCNKCYINSDIHTLSKKGEDRLFLPFIDIKTLEIGLDETKFTFNGLIKDDSKSQTNININLNVKEWNKLLEKFVEEEILSVEKYDIVLNLISDITGEAPPQPTIDIKISKDHTGIKLCKKYTSSLVNHLKRFITSK